MLVVIQPMFSKEKQTGLTGDIYKIRASFPTEIKHTITKNEVI